MPEVIVNVDADGNVKVEAQGVRGSSCAALTRAIEQAIGTTVKDQKTAAYFQQEQAHVRSGGANQP